MPLRIAMARVSQESNALSPVITTLDDFRRTHWMDGKELLDACAPRAWEAKGFMRNAELSGFVKAVRTHGDSFEIVPLFSAWAVPGGPLSEQAFDYFANRILQGLRDAGQLDGFMLSMHGSLTVQNVDDPEGRLLERVREVLGDEVPIAVTMDLHANLTPRKVDNNTIICGYRTNPHRDHAACGRRAGEILCRRLLGEVQPTTAWRTLPMVLGGGTTMDFLKPMRPIFRWMKKQERDPKVLYISLFNCHLWIDDPEKGWSTHVITDDDPALAERLAEELADLAWAVRNELPPEFPNASEAIRQARDARLARQVGTVCMSDASDMVGAGGTGENTVLLKAFLDEGADLSVLLPMRDPVAVDELAGHAIGSEVELDVGGRLDPARNKSVRVRGVLRTLREVDGFGKVAVVQIGKLHLAITEGAAIVMHPRFYRGLDLNPWKSDVVVVKSLFPFRLYFALHNRKTIYAKTGGITDFDAGIYEIDYACPVAPKDPVEAWRPTDRRRRGMQAEASAG